MGLPTGFLDIERKDRPYEKVEKRLKNWKEFVLPLPAEEIGKQGARCAKWPPTRTPSRKSRSGLEHHTPSLRA